MPKRLHGTMPLDACFTHFCSLTKDLGKNNSRALLDPASLVGVRREWVNRILQYWSKKKLIEYEGGKLITLDLARARQERDSRL